MNWLKPVALRTATSSLLSNNIRRIRPLRLSLYLVLSLIISGLGFAQVLPQQSSAAPVGGNGSNGTGRVVRVYPLRGKNRAGPSIFGTSLGGSPPIFGTSLLTTSRVGNLQYYGGPVISNLEVVVVYWGDSVSSVVTTGIPGFFSAITNSNYMDLLSEYSTNGVNPVGGGTPGIQSIGHGSLSAVYTISPSAANSGTTLDDTQIQAELLAQIDAGHLQAPATDSNGLVTTEYMIYFPPGVTITISGVTSCVQFCAYHGTVARNLLDVPYSVMPDLGPGTGCSTGCAAGTEFDDLTTVSSHEMSESITDAAIGLVNAPAPPLAWYDNSRGENGDICNASGFPSMQTVLPGTTYTVQKEWSNLQQDCVSAPPMFSLSAPASVPAGLLTVGLTVQSSTGATLKPPYTGTVQFTSSDGSAILPSNYAFTVSDNNAHTFGNAVTLKNLGPQTLTVTDMRSGGYIGTVQLTVTPRSTGYFAVTGPSSTPAGTPFTFTVTALDNLTNPNPGYSGAVHFTSSDPQAMLPTNATLINGVGTFAATLRTAGASTITATDTVTSLIVGVTSSISVGAAAPTHFAVSAPASANSGTPFTFTVTALDGAGNVSTGYAGTVHFTSSDSQATLPANTALHNAPGTFSAILRTPGTQTTITATDTVSPPFTGVSGTISVGAPDLILSSISVLTTAPTSGGTISVSDTTSNQGLGNAGNSWTAFYLSTDGKALGSFMSSRSVGILFAGASSGPATASFTLPNNLNGTYYVIACADYTNAVVETNEANNCMSTAPFQVAAPDLIESSFSVLTTAAISGGNMLVSDTTSNQGLGNAGNSWTGFYMSNDGKTLGSFMKNRSVGTLLAGASSGPATTSFTLPNNLNGTYYVMACADYSNAVVEINEANNCAASAPIQVVGPDLIENSFSVLTTAPISGSSISVSDTATNQGLGNAGNSWTGFYMSNDGKTRGSLMTSRSVVTLLSGASSGPATTSFTLPNNLNGTYYVIACADYTNAVVETNETNNCTPSAPIQVAAADLIESSFNVLTTAPISGSSISVSDTATNQGLGNASNSWTGFYLSGDGKTLGSLLTSRSVRTLLAGASSGPVTTSFTLPNNLNGTYYVIACADYTNSVVETNETNNCTPSAPIQVAGADLIESSFNVLTTAPISGGSISVSDTATNQGLGNAGNSWTGFYLSSDGQTLGPLLRNRYAGALSAGAHSGPATTTFALPTNLNGTYYVIACADYYNAVVEANETNNCTASAPIQVH